jgi:hypothetical protein
MALVALSRRKQHAAEPTGLVEPVAEPTPELPNPHVEQLDAPVRQRRRLPRFVTGTFAGITTGIVLGAIAAVLITVAGPDVRSAVVLGTGLRAAHPTQDGVYAARIIAQNLNPTLVYAEADIALLFAPTPYEPQPEPVVETKVTPLEQDLQDNAALIFAVLGALTFASWGLIMRGLTAQPPVANAGVE